MSGVKTRVRVRGDGCWNTITSSTEYRYGRILFWQNHAMAETEA